MNKRHRGLKKALATMFAAGTIFLTSHGLVKAENSIKEKPKNLSDIVDVSEKNDLIWNDEFEYDEFEDNEEEYSGKVIHLNEYVGKLKKGVKNVAKKVKNYLPEVKISGGYAPTIRSEQSEAIREDLLPGGGYEDYNGARSDRRFKGVGTNTEFSIKQPIHIAYLNIDAKRLVEQGTIFEWGDYLEGTDIEEWIGDYTRDLKQNDIYLSREFVINSKGKKITLEPKIGTRTNSETITTSINPWTYFVLPWNKKEETWNDSGTLMGLLVNFKGSGFKVDIDYSRTTGENVSLWKNDSPIYSRERISKIEGDLNAKNFSLVLDYTPNIPKDSKSFLKGTRAKLAGEIVTRTIDSGPGCTCNGFRNFSSTVANWKVIGEKKLKDYLIGQIEAGGTLDLGSSGEFIYSKKISPYIKAGIVLKLTPKHFKEKKEKGEKTNK